MSPSRTASHTDAVALPEQSSTRGCLIEARDVVKTFGETPARGKNASRGR